MQHFEMHSEMDMVSVVAHGRLCCHLVRCSEVAIKAIAPRPDSPEWLVEEIARTRAGLMRLRQNVVLLRNPDDGESFYPVRILCHPFMPSQH